MSSACPRPPLSPSEGSSVSNAVIRRIAASKKTLVGSVLALGVAGSMLAAVPAQAAPAGAKAIAQQMIKDPAQFAAFDKIVSHESGWNPSATNASSGAYGLVQALPGSK
ncbi:hypothetical protein VR43_08160, partial [Streptomyces sp. NRRL S-104]